MNSSVLGNFEIQSNETCEWRRHGVGPHVRGPCAGSHMRGDIKEFSSSEHDNFTYSSVFLKMKAIITKIWKIEKCKRWIHVQSTSKGPWRKDNGLVVWPQSPIPPPISRGVASACPNNGIRCFSTIVLRMFQVLYCQPFPLNNCLVQVGWITLSNNTWTDRERANQLNRISLKIAENILTICKNIQTTVSSLS